MRMMKKLILLCSFAGVANAQMPSPEDIMKDNDKNSDGSITKEEAAATPLSQFFDEIDSNKDGKIVLAELQAMRPPRLTPTGTRRDQPACDNDGIVVVASYSNASSAVSNSGVVRAATIVEMTRLPATAPCRALKCIDIR